MKTNKYATPALNISLVMTIVMMAAMTHVTGNLAWGILFPMAICPLTIFVVVLILVGVMK